MDDVRADDTNDGPAVRMWDVSSLGLEQLARKTYPSTSTVVDYVNGLMREDADAFGGAYVDDHGRPVLMAMDRSTLDLLWQRVVHRRSDVVADNLRPVFAECERSLVDLEELRALAKGHEGLPVDTLHFIDLRVNHVVLGFTSVSMELRRELFRYFGAGVLAWNAGPSFAY